MEETTALVKSDTRPLFFRAMEYGIASGFFTEFFCAKVEADLVAMALRLAERHGTLSHAKGLADACYGVVGVANMGLTDTVGSNLLSAIAFLHRYGVAGCFRNGWTKTESALASLRRIHAAIPTTEDTMRVRADSGMPAEHALVQLVAYGWSAIGANGALGALLLYYEKDIAQALVQECLIEQYAGEFWRKAKQEATAPLIREKTFHTLLVTAGICGIAQPEIADVHALFVALKEGNAMQRIVRKIAVYFRPQLPPGYHAAFRSELEKFRGDTLNQLVTQARDEPFLIARDRVDILLNLRIDTQAQEARTYRETLADLMSEGYTRKDFPALLGGEIPGMPADDPALRLAVLELFVKDRRLNAQELTAILAHVPSEEWRGKIAWAKIPWSVIASAWKTIMESSVSLGAAMHDIKMSTVLADCLQGNAPDRWLRGMPIEWAYEAITLFPKARERIAFLERMDVSAEAVLRKLGVLAEIVSRLDGGHVPHAYRYVSLVLPEKWFLIWRRKVAKTPGNAETFLSFLKNRNRMPWDNREDMAAYLERIVRGIAKPWREDTKLRQEAPPFFAPYLEDAVRELLTKEEFIALQKNLQDCMPP